jgi:antitoxin MazE
VIPRIAPDLHADYLQREGAGAMKITRMDDGLAVKLPDDLVTALDLKAGDEVEVEIRRKADQPSEKTREEIIAEIRARARPLPPDYKFDREEANRRR